MKAKGYTGSLLVALLFATAGIQAQSARRPLTQEKKEQARTTYNREPASTSAKSTRPAYNRQPARTNQGQLLRNQPASNGHGKQVRKPVSMTTSENPRSTYRKPVNKVTTDANYHAPVKERNYYSNRTYYGGNHYHYAYPTTRVKVHYHHDTYANGYRVLYYPSYGEIYWTRNMYRDYHRWYPGFHWSYSYGHRIQTISAFDAKYNLGEVALVYGRVYATWHNKETDDYLLFFGGDFPYQQFTVVVPGNVARKFSWRPERFFLGEHVTINGLITTFDGSPEIVVKHRSQLSIY